MPRVYICGNVLRQRLVLGHYKSLQLKALAPTGVPSQSRFSRLVASPRHRPAKDNAPQQNDTPCLLLKLLIFPRIPTSAYLGKEVGGLGLGTRYLGLKFVKGHGQATT